MIDDSAFPSPMQHSLSGEIAYDKEFGLTKLEHFACEAMKSLIAVEEASSSARLGANNRKLLCEHAVKYAHSLINALKDDRDARRKASDEKPAGEDGTGEGVILSGMLAPDQPVRDDGVPF